MNQINSDVVDGILDNMKNHVSTLQEKLSIAGIAVSKSQTVNEKITIMKEYQDKVATLNSCWRTKNRNSLVANLQHENRHMLALEEENRQLRFALKELEEGIHLIMNDYRRVFSGFIRSDLLYDLVKHSTMNSKCSLDIDKFMQIGMVSDKCMRAAEQKFEDYEDTITKLRCENESLRDILLRLPHSKEAFTNSRKNSVIYLKNTEKTPKAANNLEGQFSRKEAPSKIPKMSYQWPVHKSKDKLIDEVRLWESKSRSKSSNDVGKIIYSTHSQRNSSILTFDANLKDLNKSKSTNYIITASSNNNSMSHLNSFHYSPSKETHNNKKDVFRSNDSMNCTNTEITTQNLGSIECCSVETTQVDLSSQPIDEVLKSNNSLKTTTFEISTNKNYGLKEKLPGKIEQQFVSNELNICEEKLDLSTETKIDNQNLTINLPKEVNGHLNNFFDDSSPTNTIKKNPQKEICIN